MRRAPASLSVLPSRTAEESGYLDWFRHRTTTKLPGSFNSGFWTTLLLQASPDEPAVLHAVLALSSVHKTGVMKPDSILAGQEQFTLQHYVKAISHLQPHFSTTDRASSRVALITCGVFVCLELLRGHFSTAHLHLQNGLKILEEMHMLSRGDGETRHLKPCHGSTDDWIVETFSRLHLQVELFRYSYQHPCLVLQAARPEPPAARIHSVNEAWQHLERLLNQVFHVTHQARQQAESERGSCQQSCLALLRRQHLIRAELAGWPRMYEAFRKGVQSHDCYEEERVHHLLCAYHTMATIMADTCLLPGCESTFDSHTDRFVLLIRQLADIRLAVSPTDHHVLPGRVMDMDMAWSVIDMGWVAPLYYAAVKCRVHRIRLQAVRLLETTSHREGFWDATTAACAARKVMEVEERDFYGDVDTADDFPLCSSPCPRDLALPALPESYRLRELEVVLSGAPMDRILLFCKQEQDGIDCRVLVSEYDARLRRWVDGGVGTQAGV